MKIDVEVIAVEPLSNGFCKVTVALLDTPSLHPGPNCLFDIVCKGGREFSARSGGSRPWRWDEGGGDDDDPFDPQPTPPTNLEPDPIAPSDPELGLKLKERA